MFERGNLRSMRTGFIVVLALCALIEPILVRGQGTDETLLLKMQEDTLTLLRHVYQPLHHNDFVEIAKTYNISQNKDLYKNQEVVQDFLQHITYTHVPKGKVFSAFQEDQLKEAIALFRLFYSAKDYDTFLKTSAWARQNVNEGLFVYSYLAALIHRPDTKDVMIPPIHEINPYYFFDKEVIHSIQKNKSVFKNDILYKISRSESFLKVNPKGDLSYYLEDVGISSYYYFYHLYYPFWLGGEEYGFKNINRGEQYYFFYQQLLARYYLERISNGFGKIPVIDWNVPVRAPFYSSLEYPNGQDFPNRPSVIRFEDSSSYSDRYTHITDYERRINDIIDRGFLYARNGTPVKLYSEEGLDMLGNLVQANKDSPCDQYFGPLWLHASHLLGYSHQGLEGYKIAPSVLEHFETALRDPIFYKLYKKLLLKFQRYYSKLPAYINNDLVFKGVAVKSIVVSQLVTYYDYFYSDISNAAYFNSEELKQGPKSIQVRQHRLNSKPFAYTVAIQSDKATRSVIKIFLGPKYDENGRYINLTENSVNMVLFDYFVFDLKRGKNIVRRNSTANYYYGSDSISFADLDRHVKNKTIRSISDQKNYFFFPRRYILPKGSGSGTPYQFYVIVYPYKPKPVQLSNKYESYYYPYVDGHQFYDSYPLGYPFDRFIPFENLFFEVPNSLFQEVKIYHTGAKTV